MAELHLGQGQEEEVLFHRGEWWLNVGCVCLISGSVSYWHKLILGKGKKTGFFTGEPWPERVVVLVEERT